MNLFHLARNPPRWLRAALASLLIVLALDSLAHAQHSHGHDREGRPGVDAALCGYCVAFDRVIDGPAPAVVVIAPVPGPVERPTQPLASPPLRIHPPFSSRGPPAA